MQIFKWIRDNYFLVIILVFSLLVRLYYSGYDAVWWDSAVYVGMAKYIFSFGNSGFWEISRPLVTPMILGFFWKLGANPYVTGRVLDVFFSLGCVFLTYLIGKEIFSKRVGLFSAFLLSFTPTFFNNGNYLLTGISSTFFSLLGMYFFIRKRYFLTGLFCGIGFMTRFIQLFVFIAIAIFSLFQRKDFLKRNLMISSGFLIPVVPYLIFNIILYSNPVFTFLHQAYMTKNVGFFHEPFTFYLVNMLRENLLVVFIFLAPFYYIKSKDNRKHILFLIFLIFAIFYFMLSTKEMRFLITLMPYLFIFVSLGLFFIVDRFNKKFRISALVFLLSIFFLISMQNYDLGQQNNKFEAFWSYMEKEDVNEGVWIGDPRFALHSDKKVFPMYYDVFGSSKIIDLKGFDKPQHVLLDTCDLVCLSNDLTCPGMKEDFIDELKNGFNMVFYEKKEVCERLILTS